MAKTTELITVKVKGPVGGRWRAGLRFTEVEGEHEVTAEQLALIEVDPLLSVVRLTKQSGKGNAANDGAGGDSGQDQGNDSGKDGAGDGSGQEAKGKGKK